MRANPFILALALTFLYFTANGYITLNTAGYSRFDGFTESLVMDSAVGYSRRGFSHDAALPVVSDRWIKAAFPRAAAQDTEHVYLHSPCMAYWLGGLGVLLFGPGDVRWQRVIPMAVNALLLLAFLQGVFSVLTDQRRQLWFIVFFTAVPMGWATLGEFSPNAYAHYVLLALVGILLPVFCPERPALSLRHCVAAGFYGLLAGFFTWDYFFVMALAPLAVACLYHGEWLLKDHALRAAALRLSVFVIAGFVFAQGVHLLQVVIYYGSLGDAVSELGDVGYYRATGDASRYHFLTGLTAIRPCSYCDYIFRLGPLWGRLTLAWHYLISLTASDFGREPVLVLPVLAYVIAAAMYVGVRGDRIMLFRFLGLALVSMTACLLWPMIMENHGVEHTRLIARHFYLVYILLVLFTTECFSDSKDAAPAL